MTKAAAHKLARMLRASGHKVRVVKRRLGRELFWFVEQL
jgi:transposase